ARLQLLGSGTVFLINRLKLLVCRAKFFIGCFGILPHRSEPRLRQLQFLPQPPDRILCCALLAAFVSGRFRTLLDRIPFDKEDQRLARRCRITHDRPYLQIDAMKCAIEADQDRKAQSRLLALEGATERGPQVKSEFWPHEFGNVWG